MHHPGKPSPILPLAERTSSEDAWGEEYAVASWLWRNRVPDLLGNRASVLLPDILRRDLDVDQRGLNLCMPHELHQGGEADACPNHV